MKISKSEEKNRRIHLYLQIFAVCSVIYFVLDFSVRMTGFLRFGDSVGIKNFLAAILGLVFGPMGALGCCLGCVMAALLSGTLSLSVVYEWISNLVVGIGLWALWHVGKHANGTVFLKKPRDYLKYSLILCLLSALAGLLGRFFLPEHTFWPYFVAYFGMGIVVGMPVLILLTSIVCVKPILPPWISALKEYEGVITADPASLTLFNEGLEEYAFMKHKLTMKEIFGVQNCIEEVHIRLMEKNRDISSKVWVRFHDSVSIDFEYEGERITPFRADKNTPDEELIGLKLLLHRALRTSHSYMDGLNHVHIVM